MTITMPEGLQKLSDVVVGTNFPEGDEDALRRLAEAWMTCAGEVESVLGDTEAAVRDALSTMEGRTAEAFKEYGDGLTQGDEAPLVKLQTLCEKVGEACDKVALEVEYTKISIITALSLLFAQIAAALAMAVVTFGASTAAIPAMQAGTRVVVRGIMETLKYMMREIASQTAINVGVNVGVDRAIQAGQFAAGHREEWDNSKLKSATLSGLAGGIGGGIAGGVFRGAADNISDKLAGNAAKDSGVQNVGKNAADEATNTPGGQNAGKNSGDDAPKGAGDQNTDKNVADNAPKNSDQRSFTEKFSDNVESPPGGMNDPVGWGSSIGYGMVNGTAGGTMGGALNNQFQGEEHSQQNMGSAALGGSVGGGLSPLGSGLASGLEQSSLPSFGPGNGQDPGNSTPDPNAGQDQSGPDNQSGPDAAPDAGQGNQSGPDAAPDAGPGNQSGPDAAPDAGQGNQSDQDKSAPDQSGQDAGQDQSGPSAGQDQSGPIEESRARPYIEFATNFPPHMVNAPGDMYSDEVDSSELPKFDK